MNAISTTAAQQIIDSKNSMRITALINNYALSWPMLRQLVSASGTTAYVRTKARQMMNEQKAWKTENDKFWKSQEVGL